MKRRRFPACRRLSARYPARRSDRGLRRGWGRRRLSRLAGHVGSAAGDYCARRLLQGARRRRVVAMRMGHQHVTQSFAADACKQRFDVTRVVRSGVDDRHIAVSDEVAACSRVGERTGIWRERASRQRRDARRNGWVCSGLNDGALIATEGPHSHHKASEARSKERRGGGTFQRRAAQITSGKGSSDAAARIAERSPFFRRSSPCTRSSRPSHKRRSRY